MRLSLFVMEDLGDWTRHYRRIRDASISITKETKDPSEIFLQQKLQELANCWECLSKDGIAERYDMSVQIVGHHISVQATVLGGSVDPGGFLKFIDEHEKAMSFCRIGDLGDKLCCYVPKLSVGSATTIFNGIVSVISTVVDGMSSDDVRARFEFAEREGILPWVLDLPVDFRMFV